MLSDNILETGDLMLLLVSLLFMTNSAMTNCRRVSYGAVRDGNGHRSQRKQASGGELNGCRGLHGDIVII